MTERHLEAVRRVDQAREVVQRQRVRVEQLRAVGRPATMATSEALLEIYISTLTLFEEHERDLREQLETRAGRSRSAPGFRLGARDRVGAP